MSVFAGWRHAKPRPLSRELSEERLRTPGCWALVRLVHLFLWFVKCPATENAFQKTLQVDFAPGHSLQTYLNIAWERQIRSAIQIEKSADVAKCKRAMFWLTDDRGDRMLMPSVNAAKMMLKIIVCCLVETGFLWILKVLKSYILVVTNLKG